MDKRVLVIGFLVITIVMIVLLIKLIRSKEKKTKAIGLQIILGILMNGVYITSLLANNERASEFLHAIVMIIESWIWYLFLRYAYDRFHAWKVDKKRDNIISMLLIMADNILLLVNAFTGVLFEYKTVTVGDKIHVQTEWTWFTIVHLLGCTFIGVSVIIIMIRKALTVAKVYRLRYIVSSILFACGTLLVVIGRLMSGNNNMFSVIFVSLGIIGNYYWYFRYPMVRAGMMKTYAINNMADPVLMFDYNNHLQVYNAAAERMLGVSSYYSLEEYIEDNELCYKLETKEKHHDKEREFTRTKVINARTYLIYGRELWDLKDRFVGTLVVYTDITGQERLKDEATLYATRDQLTGLWNRDYFFEIAGKTIMENPNEKFLMIASDIYHFKLFNEILGTDTGDDLLLAFAQAYRENYKRMWVFSRIAADRFALLIPKSDFSEEGILAIVHDVLERRNYSLKAHCYLGVYDVAADKSVSVEGMYDRAYMALESIKGDLHKEIAYYQEELLNERIHETITLDELDRALLNDEFVIYLQPQVSVSTEEVISAEALIRWNKPGRGIVSPGEFIPIFENNGMIAKLDYYVWELACRQLAKWKEMGYENRSLSVNISAKDFYLTDLYESVTGLVEKYEVNPVNLKLEITETAFVLDVKKQMKLVRRLQDYGFLIEIDDFGSGYSSLHNLKEIMADMLKMDLKFFEKTDEKERAEKIITSVIKLANDLGMPVIAEGVETEEDMQIIRKAGCQIVQGFYYAKPMSVDDFESFLKTRPYGELKPILDKIKDDLK